MAYLQNKGFYKGFFYPEYRIYMFVCLFVVVVVFFVCLFFFFFSVKIKVI